MAWVWLVTNVSNSMPATVLNWASKVWQGGLWRISTIKGESMRPQAEDSISGLTIEASIISDLLAMLSWLGTKFASTFSGGSKWRDKSAALSPPSSSIIQKAPKPTYFPVCSKLHGRGPFHAERGRIWRRSDTKQNRAELFVIAKSREVLESGDRWITSASVIAASLIMLPVLDSGSQALTICAISKPRPNEGPHQMRVTEEEPL
ncbi:hypothetical protein EDB81DRAFT_760984 [Dactylonectria macrodidyma]|uniref:Uncharacterized protein n=1 Tax=Dactylonectria macrodidyma TaxID=307937 RepID=A0A9P9EQX2_9HYPO|nr:hypothetical protein EDB81DRAFT_760984 [Dactylonectria macrodidyma]